MGLKGLNILEEESTGSDILVKHFFLQPGAGCVGGLLNITEVGEFLLLPFPFFMHPVRSQVFSCCSLNVSHQLCITPVYNTKKRIV